MAYWYTIGNLPNCEGWKLAVYMCYKMSWSILSSQRSFIPNLTPTKSLENVLQNIEKCVEFQTQNEQKIKQFLGSLEINHLQIVKQDFKECEQTFRKVQNASNPAFLTW